MKGGQRATLLQIREIWRDGMPQQAPGKKHAGVYSGKQVAEKWTFYS
jgi:hypothetical protein